MHNRALRILIITQVVIISAISIVLLQGLQGKNRQVLSANSLNRENLTFSNSAIDQFYEPAPNTKEVKNLSLFGDEFNYSVEYVINKDGLNQNTNFSIEKPKKKYRIITLGDSFTFGTNVNTKDNYPSQFR